MTDAAVTSERDLARKRRVDNFDAISWLRGNRLAAEEASEWEVTTRRHGSQETSLVFEPPKLDSPKVQNFLTEQEFEGVVLSVDELGQTFWARLADCTAGNPDEEAEFPFAEIPSDDWSLISPGALFSWNVGREWRDRQVRRVSDIRFRRCFRFSPAVVAKAKLRASRLSDLLAEANDYPAGDTPEKRRA